jgi:hypothetical protein
MGGGGESVLSSFDGKGKDLSEAIESLPEILFKKANLEQHTNIMHSLMKKISSREIPTFFEMEQSILISNGKSIDRFAAITLLKDSTKGNILDKGRLLTILAVMSDPSSLTKQLNDELDSAFIEGCSSMLPIPPSKDEMDKLLSAVNFIRKLIQLQSSTSLMMRSPFGGSSSSSSSNSQILSSFLNYSQSKANSLIAKAATFFTKFTPYNITRIVLNLSDASNGKGGIEDETFLYLDPKASSSTGHQSTMPITGQKYSTIIVFMLGGGCYSEYYNLLESLKEKTVIASGYPKNIIYGCSDLLSGDEFMKQIENMVSSSLQLQQSQSQKLGNTSGK